MLESQNDTESPTGEGQDVTGAEVQDGVTRADVRDTEREMGTGIAAARNADTGGIAVGAARGRGIGSGIITGGTGTGTERGAGNGSVQDPVSGGDTARARLLDLDGTTEERTEERPQRDTREAG